MPYGCTAVKQPVVSKGKYDAGAAGQYATDASKIRQTVYNHFGREPTADELKGINAKWFANNQLGGLVYGKFKGSPYKAIKCGFLEYFDYNRPDHLHEWDFKQFYLWKGKRGEDLAKEAIIHRIRECFGGEPKPEELKNLTKTWFSKNGIRGALSRFGNSPYKAIRNAYPEYFDYSKPNHLHEWDFSRQGVLKGSRGDKLAKDALRHTVEGELGRKPTSEDLKKIDGQWFKRHELALLHSKFKGSTYYAIKCAYCEYFDYNRQDHLHEWDFKQQGMWKGEEGERLAKEAISHTIESYLGRVPNPEDLKKLSYIWFYENISWGAIEKFGNSQYKAIRHVYPGYFDYNRPDHLHEWDFSRQGMWKGSRGDKLAKDALRHTVEGELGRKPTSEDLKKIDGNWFKDNKLGGLFDKFKSSVYKALRHVYPEYFDCSRPDYLHEWDIQHSKMWTKQNGELAKKAIRHKIANYFGREPTPEDLTKIDYNWFHNQKLEGLLQAKFNGATHKALEFAYPNYYLGGPKITSSADLVKAFDTYPKIKSVLPKLSRGDEARFADILTVVYAGRLKRDDALNLVSEPSLRAYLGECKPPKTVAHIAEPAQAVIHLDKEGVIAGIILDSFREYGRKKLGDNPTRKQKAALMAEFKTLFGDGWRSKYVVQ